MPGPSSCTENSTPPASLPAGKRDRAAVRRIVGGVAEQIEEDLPDAVLVAVEARGARDVSTSSVIECSRSRSATSSAAAAMVCVDADLGDVELHDAGIDGRQVENVVDDGEQHRGRRADMLDIFALPLASAGR